MKIRDQINSILAKLGFTAKAKDGLSPEEAEQVAAEYKTQYGSDLASDLAKMKEDEQKAEAFNAIRAALMTMAETEDDSADEAEAEQPAAEINVVKRVERLMKENNELKKENEEMAKQAVTDSPEAVFIPAKSLAGVTTPQYLYGIEHEIFSMKKRWNRISAQGKAASLLNEPTKDDYVTLQADVTRYGVRLAARINELHAQGHLNVTALVTEGTIDYSAIRNINLGDQYVIRRMDALIAQIIMLPGLTDLFPMRSNVQDGEILTSAFFGEFSQGYQEGEISKGSMTLEPELAKVHDIMFKYLIKSFKWIERTYLGYLNTSGSHPIKWNLIEWLVLEIAKVLKNEQNKRLVLGHYVPPVEGKTQPYQFGTTGVVYKLLEYVDNNKLLPFDDSVFNTYTATNIGDAMDAFAAEVAAVTDLDLTQLAIYINLKHKPWYLAWYRTKYGKDIDFTGPELKMMNYDIPIKFVPNMGNSTLMFITKPGNIQTLENVPGEMNAVNFEQRLESVWAYSVWKEGVSAVFVGKQFADKTALKSNNYADQLIFMNYPVTEVDADATTLDGSKNFIFRTAANSAAAAITDITNAKKGVVYEIVCGSTTNASTIAKSGKFADLTSAWSPAAVGDWIKVYYDADNSKFVEVARS